MNNIQPIFEIKSKMGILHKFINIIVILFSFGILYSLYMTTSLMELIEAIKKEWATILIFPFTILMIWGFIFCLNEVIFNNQRKIVLYNDYFIVQTYQFFFKKTMYLHYGEYGLVVRFRPPLFYVFIFYDMKKQKLPFGWFDAKIKGNFYYPLFDKKIAENVDKFLEIFKQKTKKTLESQGINHYNLDEKILLTLGR
ncbi:MULTISPECIES: hypothetical protein [Helicobacter]|uniref:Uncharacterized protein n=4 Tax=Helicobacter TaxID=209 RepID=A0A4U8TLV8_9HELI|nr:hypothetical protein [Helicobacter japonicus]TLE01491.1 hypothetical protein LS65_005895 [Helicobacter japonicus]